MLFGSTYLMHNVICHIYFSKHKLNFNFRLCRVEANIIVYSKDIFDESRVAPRGRPGSTTEPHHPHSPLCIRVAPPPEGPLGTCETWVPLGPTDQAHGRPRQVGPAYQKKSDLTVVGPTDLVGGPHDLLKTF
jgi:hypothetical protein